MDDKRPAPIGRPPGEPKKQIAPMLPIEMIERLKALADTNKRTISAEVEAAVEAHLARAAALAPA